MEPLAALANEGYFHCQGFAAPAEGVEAASRLAAQLGARSHGVVRTVPSVAAEASRPFDRQEALGWHNDFTTHSERPRFSLSFIEQQDPRGSPWGDWRVARVRDVLDLLGRSSKRDEIVKVLKEPHPFEFAGEVFLFPVLTMQEGTCVMRFYGDGLRRGYDIAPRGKDYLRVVTAVEDAADECAVELVASTGALLIVDNRLTLHYRREQTVVGSSLRHAHLMFAG